MSEAIKRHADGAYIGLPIEDYVADDAIGGHGAAKLATSPSDWRWEREDNPLWSAPKSDAKAQGTLVHCLLLEGRGEFDRRYAPPPKRAMYPDALETGEQFKAKLRALEAEHCKTLGVEKLKPAERQPFLLNGKVEELAARIRALDKGAMFWDDIVAEHVGDRVMIGQDDLDYAEMATRLAIAAYGDLLELDEPRAFSEVSIFFTIDGVRFKARPDRGTRSRIVDVKKYGTTPKPQHCLRQHLVAQAAQYQYPVQAVMQSHAAKYAADHFETIAIEGGTDIDRENLRDVFAAWSEKLPAFWWLFLRCPGPPGGKPLPFRTSDAMWGRAQETINIAIDNYRHFRGVFGDELWIDAQDREEISSEVGEESDWPSWAWKTPLGGAY